MDAKPWYTSKTLVVNLLSLVAALLVAALGQAWVAGNPALAAWLAAALAFVNLVLRTITGQPIAGTPADPAATLPIEPPRF